MIDSHSSSVIMIALCYDWLGTSGNQFTSIRSPVMRPRLIDAHQRVVSCEACLNFGLSSSANELIIGPEAADVTLLIITEHCG